MTEGREGLLFSGYSGRAAWNGSDHALIIGFHSYFKFPYIMKWILFKIAQVLLKRRSRNDCLRYVVELEMGLGKYFVSCCSK